jgi:hypothetical protein
VTTISPENTEGHICEWQVAAASSSNLPSDWYQFAWGRKAGGDKAASARRQLGDNNKHSKPASPGSLWRCRWEHYTLLRVGPANALFKYKTGTADYGP